jgi:hypothetical protein
MGGHVGLLLAVARRFSAVTDINMNVDFPARPYGERPEAGVHVDIRNTDVH